MNERQTFKHGVMCILCCSYQTGDKGIFLQSERFSTVFIHGGCVRSLWHCSKQLDLPWTPLFASITNKTEEEAHE